MRTKHPVHRRLAARAAIERCVEPVERRLLFAAHVLGSTASYTTIQAAVNAASVGGTVSVDAGTYAEQVTVSKTLTILGARAGVDARGGGRASAGASTESVVNGALSGGKRSTAFRILANNVTLDGFTVSGETSTDETLGAGIVLGPGISGTKVLNNVVKNNVAGMFLANYSSTNGALIQHNYFGSNNNDGANGGRGIYTNGTISGGNLTNVTIDANTFTNNLGGDGTTGLEAAMAFEAGTPGRQSAIRITNNTLSNNGKAVLFFNATNVLIQGNTITGSQDQWSGSLRFEGNNNSVSILYNNAYSNTGPAVAVDSKGMPGDNSAFVVSYNNFYGNNYAYSVPISVANNFDSYVGSFDARFNYWGSAKGPSGYGPGTGDAVGGGFMQIGTGKGWALTAGGNIVFSGWSTTPVTLPGSAPAAPAGLIANADAATQVSLTWVDNAVGNESGFVIQRSSDGVTFAQIASTSTGVTTFTDTAGVGAGKTYSYRVMAVNVAGTSAASNVAAVTTPAVGNITYLSDIAWSSATAGYSTVHKDASVKGTAITLRGTTYAKGLGTHAVSSIVYTLNGSYGTFAADVGLDDEVAGNGAVDFQVIGDGKVLFDSGVVTGVSPVVGINVSVVGINTLTLVATNGVSGSIDYDHADWANARLLLTPTPTPAPAVPAGPTGLTATTASTSQISLAWKAGDAAQTGFAIDRSTDGGTTFAALTTVAAGVLAYVDTGLTAGTTYVYRVRATNAVGTSVASGTASATTTPTTTTAVTTSLTKLTPTTATVGWGTLQTNTSIKGTAIKLRGTTYALGLGAHASSTVTYALAGKYALFTSDAGIDDEVSGKGAVDFQVYGDGKLLYDSGVLTGTSAIAHLSVNVTGVQTLTLQASPGVAGSIDYDHADWANPLLTTAATTAGSTTVATTTAATLTAAATPIATLVSTPTVPVVLAAVKTTSTPTATTTATKTAVVNVAKTTTTTPAVVAATVAPTRVYAVSPTTSTPLAASRVVDLLSKPT